MESESLPLKRSSSAWARMMMTLETIRSERLFREDSQRNRLDQFKRLKTLLPLLLHLKTQNQKKNENSLLLTTIQLLTSALRTFSGSISGLLV